MKYIILLGFAFITLTVNAQKFDGVKIQQKDGELLLQYDLYGSTDIAFNVGVLYSTDKQIWKKVEKLYGDQGDSIFTGRNKQIVLWFR